MRLVASEPAFGGVSGRGGTPARSHYTPPMLDSLRRFGGLFGGLTIAALLGGMTARFAAGPRGTSTAVLSVASSPGTAIAAVFVLVLALALLAVVVSRLVNSAVGLFVFGVGIAIFSMRCGAIADATLNGAAATNIALETLVWGAVLLGITFVLLRLGGRLPDIPISEPLFRGALANRALIGCAAAIFAPVAVWLVLRNDLKGQAIAAAVIAGLITGLFGRLWAPRAQPILLPAAAVVAIGAAQLVAAMRVEGSMLEIFDRGLLPRVLAALPMDVAGGVAVGVAMGLGWARSFGGDAAATESLGTAPLPQNPLLR